MIFKNDILSLASKKEERYLQKYGKDIYNNYFQILSETSTLTKQASAYLLLLAEFWQ